MCQRNRRVLGLKAQELRTSPSVRSGRAGRQLCLHLSRGGTSVSSSQNLTRKPIWTLRDPFAVPFA